MPLILGTNSIKDTGYEVANSCRFSGGNDYLRTNGFGTPTSSRKMTISFWCKRSGFGGNDRILTADTSGSNNNRDSIVFSSNTLNIFLDNAVPGHLKTNRLFRDPSAWTHIVIAIDTTQSTDTNRIKIYVNGVQETSFDSSGDGIVYPSQNYDILGFGQNRENTIGADSTNGGDNDFLDGYLAEYCFIDGQQLDADQFGEFDSDSNIWKPINVSGLTFGNNGFYLDFENASSLGADVSGNSNNFTVNNLTSIDQTTDTCTNNFITWSPLTPRSSDITLSEGNCNVTMGGTSRGIFATIGVSSGKWYYESKWVSGSFFQTGIVATDTMNDNDDVYGGKTGAFMYKQNGDIRSGGSTLASVSSLSTGDIVGVYLDLDNNELYFAKNGTIQNSGTGIDISAYSEYTFGCAPTSAVLSANFGNPTFSISSGNTDPEGFGNFEHSPNDGGSASFDSSAKNFFALNTKNLAEYG